MTHTVPMESLHDSFSEDELRDFDRRVRAVVDDPVYVVEPKFDGLSVALELSLIHISTSDALLEAVQPQYAVISSGEDRNLLPRNETLKPVSYTHLDVYKRQLRACPSAAKSGSSAADAE